VIENIEDEVEKVERERVTAQWEYERESNNTNIISHIPIN